MNIIIWDKNSSSLRTTREEVKKHMQHGFYLIQQCVDITNRKQVNGAYMELHRKLEEIDIPSVSVIINNAGVVYDIPMERMDLDEVDNTFAINTISQFTVIHTFMPDLVSQAVSNIVNISSLIAMIPASHLASYSASKVAIRAMSDCLRLEFKSTGKDHIRVTTILPQFIKTGMFEGTLNNEHLGHRLKNYFFPENTPEEIANEIVYAIEHEKDEIILPRMLKWALPFLSLFPHVITDYLFMFFGGKNGMDGFKGRGDEWNQSYRLKLLEQEHTMANPLGSDMTCDCC
ncbi:hypothetical protein WA171_004198, partial [Blastocystis sp. BT1]